MILDRKQTPSSAIEVAPITSSICLSINKKIIDKNILRNNFAFGCGWEDEELTADQFADAINRGYAFSAQFKEGIRKKSNFVKVGFLAVDIDGTMTLDEGHQNEWVKRYGTLLYTTPSHDPAVEHRFRVVFATPSPIKSVKHYKAALLGLSTIMNADRSATDPARCFFGSTNSQPELLGNSLSVEALAKLRDYGRQVEKQEARAKKQTREEIGDEPFEATTNRASAVIGRDMLIRRADGKSSVLAEIPRNMPVHCPMHSDEKPSAFVVQSSKSKSPGIHCSACAKTFWLKGTALPKYDFYRFEKLARQLSTELHGPESEERFVDGPIRDVKIVKEKYLSQLDLIDGITLVRSPKGTGKTQQLQRIVGQAKLFGKSVLLIGHRQTLIREISKRLGIHCYLDDDHLDGADWKQSNSKKFQRPKLYAVSVDSLSTRLKNKQHYDVVLIDESEQVLSHTSAKTIKKPLEVMHALQRYVTSAPAVYLFDADLNNITHDFVTQCRKINQDQNIRIWLNEYVDTDRTYDLFDSETHLTQDLIKNVKKGKRIFVACNSKKRAKALHNLLQREVGPTLKSILITAEERAETRVNAFLANVRKEILNYDVVVASPAIGTGIDITFPDNAQMIEAVYGFFNARINSHYDCDQQIGRVRNPKEVKIWISGQRLEFEIEPEVIKRDLVETGEMAAAVNHYDQWGNPIFDPNHPLLALVANVYCAQRASQNNLKSLFVAHKKHNGWKAIRIRAPNEDNGAAIDELHETKTKITQSAFEMEQERVAQLCAATRLNDNRFQELKRDQAKQAQIGVANTYAVERYEIEKFYGEIITPELIGFDRRGAMRAAIKRFGSLTIGSGFRDLLQNQWDQYQCGGRMKKSEFPGRVLEMVLFSAGLVNESGLDAEKVFSKEELQKFLKFCDDHKITIERNLEVLLRKDRYRDPVKMLNRFLGLIGLDATLVTANKKGKEKVYRYQIQQDRFRLVERFRKRFCEERMENLDTERRVWIPCKTGPASPDRLMANPAIEADLCKLLFGM